MSNGIKVKTPNGQVLLSSDVEPFCYFGKAWYSSNQGNNTHAFATNCPEYPLVFMHVPYGESAAVLKVSGSAGAWTIFVLTTTTSIQLYIFNRASNVSGSDGYGIKLFDKFGRQTYNSGKKPLAVRDSLYASPDGTYNFTFCQKPIFAYFPFAIRESESATWKSYQWSYTYTQCDTMQSCQWNTYYRSELQCQNVQQCGYQQSYSYVCNYDFQGNYVCSNQPSYVYVCNNVQQCNWVNVPYQQYDCTSYQYCYQKIGWNTMYWREWNWSVQRETLRLNSQSQFSTTWVENAYGYYNTDIQTATNDPMGWKSPGYYYPGEVNYNYINENARSPYANSGINYQPYLCLVSDGALYD